LTNYLLKSNLQVIEGSREVIDLKFGFGDPLVLHHQQDTADKLGERALSKTGGVCHPVVTARWCNERFIVVC